jgi:hypothetical protein
MRQRLFDRGDNDREIAALIDRLPIDRHFSAVA